MDVAGKEGCGEIGRDIAEELEYEPGRLYANRYIRSKYASAGNQTILVAPLPELIKSASCCHIIGNCKRLFRILPKINEIYYHE